MCDRPISVCITSRGRPVRNIGPTTQAWLHEIGIFSVEDIRQVGVIETFRRLKATFPRQVTANALYGLEAAVLDIDWRAIPAERRAELCKEAGLD